MHVLLNLECSFFADGVASALIEENWKVTQSSSDSDLRRLIESTGPAVVLTDASGLKSWSTLQPYEQCQCPVVVFVDGDDLHTIRTALRLKVSGLLHPNADRAELIEALTTCIRGIPYASNSLAQTLARAALGLHPSRDQRLTDRQVQIAKLVCAGHSSVDIAKQLAISRRTVEFHRGRILKKLGVHSTVEMAQLLVLDNFERNGRPVEAFAR